MDPQKTDDTQLLKPTKAVAAIIFAILLLICIGAGLGYYRAVTFLTTPASVTGREQVFLIKPGQGLNRIATDLAAKGLISNQTLFKLYDRYKQAAGRLKAGEYHLSPQLPPVQILDLLLDLQQEKEMAMTLITHDMAMIAETVETVVVMYAGQVVEKNSTQNIFSTPGHPYTEALLNALPERNVDARRLPVIPGVVPGKFDRPRGCLFHPRCGYAKAVCREEPPSLESRPDGSVIRCHFPLT